MRRCLPFLLVLLAFACACGGRGGGSLFAPPQSERQRITADWLRKQPGPQLGEFSFHLLDVDAQPIRGWQGLEVAERTDGAAREFILSAEAGAPDDVYLYVAYPSESWAADFARLADSAGRTEDYALLAIPRRTPDVLVIGITRLGAKRGSAVQPGPLAVLRFMPGFDIAFKQISAVSSDPRSAPLLMLEPPATAGGNVTLRWEERNIGDYNNNGLVEIADVSPIGQLFKQTTSTAADPLQFELVDGDGNGEVNASDLQPIGRNYQTSIDGYMAYQAGGSTPPLDHFVPIAGATLDRDAVFDATAAAERKHRLKYSYSFDPPAGTHSFLVRAFVGNDPAAGMPSNVVEFTTQSANRPPAWESSVGITSIEGITGGLRIHFGRAVDPEGAGLTYLLRYVQGAGPVGSPGTIDLPLPLSGSTGEPPYSYDLLGLASGTQYTLLLVAEDDLGQRTNNTASLSATTPGLTMPTDPWSCWRGNPMRTGSNPASTVREPLTLDWSQSLASYHGGPLVTTNGDVVISRDADIVKFSFAGGAPVGSPILLDNYGSERCPALHGRWLAALSGLSPALVDLNAGTAAATPLFASGTYAPLLILGDYLFAGDTSTGTSSMLLSSGSTEWTQPMHVENCACCTDGNSLYVVGTSRELRKYRLLDGELEASGSLNSTVAGNIGASAASLVFGNNLIYCSTTQDRVETHRASDLGLEWTVPPVLDDGMIRRNLLLANQFSPPLLLSATSTLIDKGTRLLAVDPVEGTQRWMAEFDNFDPQHLAADNARIFLTGYQTPGSGCLVLDPADGSRLQKIEGSFQSEPVAASNRLLLAESVVTGQGYSLNAYEEGPPQPVTWTGTTGIRHLDTMGTDGLRVFWDGATAPHGLVIRYAVHYLPLPMPGSDMPPAFVPPFMNTTVVAGLSAADGAAGYLLTGLTPGQRYSVGVRAYYGKWGENAVTDGNTNWLAATAAWTQQPPLDLGAAPPPGGTQLPDGEVYLMQGVFDDAGRIHLIYNDEADTHLTHIYQDAAGAWQVEAGAIATHIANDFELQWADGALHIAYTEENNGNVGILRRTGSDSWTEDVFAANTVANPQVAFAMDNPVPPGGQGVLVYNEYAGGGGLSPDTDYNMIRTDPGGNWLDSAPFDATNFCGRDLAVALNPADITPWVALQRGYVYAPNRLTPQNGELFWGTDDGAGGYSFTLVDAGDNPNAGGGDTDSSDVGKRVRLAMDSAGLPHLAYLDLNASASVPLGQLKYTRYTGSAWTQPDVVTPVDLSFQSFASLQYTWGELSFGLTPAGSPAGADRPVIGMLGRTSATNILHQAHAVHPLIYIADGAGNWLVEQLDAAQDVYPNDREPCVLLLAPDAWHFFMSTSRDSTPSGQRAKRIKYWKRAL